MKVIFSLMMACLIVSTLTVITPAQNDVNQEQRQQRGAFGRQMPAKAEGAIDLLTDKNLDDWDFYLSDPNLKKEDIWSFDAEGDLVCTGASKGYLCTKEEYRDFKLTIQWRWPEGTKPTNSGLLLRIHGEPDAVPACIEAQLAYGNAGDIMTFRDVTLEGYDKRFQRHTGLITGEIKKLVNAERQPGRWNTYEVLCQEGTLVLSINGTIVNWCKDVSDVGGKIGLQSEGGPIEFRNVTITPLSKKH